MGFYSILASLKGLYVDASWAIIIAMVFDGLDGWVARLTHSTTRFGIELDSLSDLVAFGVAPAVMLYKCSLASYGRIGWSAAFLLMACGALRLARYNVQMGSAVSKSFTGMPIPGAATIIATMVIFYHVVEAIEQFCDMYNLELFISGLGYANKMDRLIYANQTGAKHESNFLLSYSKSYSVNPRLLEDIKYYDNVPIPQWLIRKNAKFDYNTIII